MPRLLPLALAFTACISAPAIVMVDRATALEEQAAGSYDDLEQRLYRAGMTPAPVPLTQDQLDALGIAPPPLVANPDPQPAERVDALLRRHCVGESRDGLLLESHQCRHELPASDRLLLERVNGARQTLWRWMSERDPSSSDEALRRGWHQRHLEGVVCGAWVQADDGTWGEKKC